LICENKLKINKNIAEEFTNYMHKYPNLYEELAKTIYEELNEDAKKPIILDLGSGPALINYEIKKLLKNSVILSLDASLEMLNNAQKPRNKTFSNKINGILSVSENIPIKNNTIDIMISRFSLSYWKNPEKAFSEIYRIIKPNGKLILEALNKNFPKWKLFLIKIHMNTKQAGKNVIKYHVDAYKNAYYFDQIKSLLLSANFKIDKIEYKNNDWKIKIIASKI
jgi:demethylmenaquinone methyltransferase/2-methoxy-6-polyprenyl-1,4-benzoquinol methylase